MNLEDKLEQDIKASMLAGDSARTTTLRMLKSAFLSAKVAAGTRDTGLSEEEATLVLAKEAKRRQESADMYKQANYTDRAEAELAEKAIIESYLPAQLTDEELGDIIDQVITDMDAKDPAMMGKVIGGVKAEVGVRADGSKIAHMVKERLNK